MSGRKVKAMKDLLTSIQVKQKVGVAALAFACTLAGTQVNAATFPNSPLITGGEGIPPNILLILDDSGSMAYVAMPSDRTSLSDQVSHRSAFNNTIFYNPATTYLPWRTDSVNLNDRWANANIRRAASDKTSPNPDDGWIDLRDDQEGIFYAQKINVANPGTSTSNYTRYYISTLNGSDAVVTERDQRQLIYSGVVQNIKKAGNGNANSQSSVDITINVPNDTSLIEVFLTGGTGNGRLNVYNPSGTNVSCSSNSDPGNEESCQISGGNIGSGPRTVRIYNVSTSTTMSNAQFTAYATANTKVAETPTYKDENGNPAQRTQAAELQNFANWFQYYRTRTKTAKAGASEAFGELGSRYRVGFDTIWNRTLGGNSGSTSGYTPSFPIPTGSNDGLFTGSNRTSFYNYLQGAGAEDGTPLKGALQRAARYYSSDGPWTMSSSTNKLSCRQNYALLTTDGYWNATDGYRDSRRNSGDPALWTTAMANVGDADSDSYSVTLADVAYKYWATDLRSDMTDNVRPTTGDPATHQHMVTFGISIGLQGTLDPNNSPPVPWNVNPMPSENATRIDDLWHASINGHGKFVVASDAKEFAKALKAALDTISERTASGSNIASSSTKTDAGTLTFAAKFTSGSWIGDLSASPFNAALTGVSTTPLWKLSDTFGTTGVNSGFANRYVLTTWNGSPIRFDTSYPGASQFERTGGTDSVSGVDNISYINGDQSKEIGRPNGTLRTRVYPIGDIVDSSPAYNADTKTVYVGANDGMLHAIDATGTNMGKVLFSYIPMGLAITDLKTLSAVEYDHRYFMDGQIDTITRAKQGYNKNILLGAPGRGAKGVFALDVTNPSVNSTALFLWDKTYNVDNDMGYVLGNVRLRQSNKKDALGKQKTFAIVPNGIDSTNGKAVIFIYELSSTGAVDATYKLTTDNATNNGMMSTGLADLDGNGTIDTIYGGDLLGRVWKWDVSTIPVNGGPTLTGTKLFTATDGTNAQPITGGIGVARDSNGQIFVGFGTGRLISLSDLPGNSGYVNQTQSLYGIKDLNTTVARADLEARSIPFTGTMNNLPVRGFQSYQDLPSAKKGWYINLGVPAATAAGERVITSPTMVGSAMWITSVIPAQGSDCSGALGSGYLNVLNIFTGTSPLQNSYFDTNGTIAGPNNTTGLVGSMGIVGGMPTEVNVTSQLATVGDGGGGSPVSFKRTLPLGGIPQRMTWREVVAPDN